MTGENVYLSKEKKRGVSLLFVVIMYTLLSFVNNSLLLL